MDSENKNQVVIIGNGNPTSVEVAIEKLNISNFKNIAVIGSLEAMAQGMVDNSLKDLEKQAKELSTWEISNYRVIDDYQYELPKTKKRGKNNTKHKPRKKKSKSFGKNKKK